MSGEGQDVGRVHPCCQTDVLMMILRVNTLSYIHFRTHREHIVMVLSHYSGPLMSARSRGQMEVVRGDSVTASPRSAAPRWPGIQTSVSRVVQRKCVKPCVLQMIGGRIYVGCRRAT